MNIRQLSPLDNLLGTLDNGLKTLSKGAYRAARNIDGADNFDSDEAQKKHTAALMRINHTGEVCAQALYQGQALTAKNRATREAMQLAADEEIDHLVWCEQRIEELGSQTSLLNPIFYGLSLTIGAVTGAISDKISLGFVEATEDQVCKHLEDHLQQVPESDGKTRAILLQMLEDEAKHGHMALQHGGTEFPKPVKTAMSLLAKVMTATTYRI
jgi:3-demethoxyubiquinol 3-hydroxylase